MRRVLPAGRVLRACKPKASPHGGTRHKALPPSRAAGRELPRGLSRGLTNSPQDCWFRRCGAVLRVAVTGAGFATRSPLPTAAPASAPCFRRRRRSPAQLFESSERANQKQAPMAGHAIKALPPSRAAGRELPRGLSRALKTPRRGVFAGRDVRRPARAVLVPDGAPFVRNVPGCCNKKTALHFRKAVPGAPSGTRTQDPLIKSQLLYQLS